MAGSCRKPATVRFVDLNDADEEARRKTAAAAAPQEPSGSASASPNGLDAHHSPEVEQAASRLQQQGSKPSDDDDAPCALTSTSFDLEREGRSATVTSESSIVEHQSSSHDDSAAAARTTDSYRTAVQAAARGKFGAPMKEVLRRTAAHILADEGVPLAYDDEDPAAHDL